MKGLGLFRPTEDKELHFGELMEPIKTSEIKEYSYLEYLPWPASLLKQCEIPTYLRGKSFNTSLACIPAIAASEVPIKLSSGYECIMW